MPVFLITIDTEGDNLWARPRTVTTRNAEFLPRFQALCESHGFKPTYLVTHEMVQSPAFRVLGRDAVARGTAEIGMHLHAWDSPPLVPLTDDDARHHPYLIEYPEAVMQTKVAALTARLQDTFQCDVVSHRAGRWALDETYARLLVDRGYRVDCSVTPGVSWRAASGDPRCRGGPDYTRFPATAYFVDLGDVSRPGPSPLLEVPVTTLPDRRPWLRRLRHAVRRVPILRGALHRLAPAVRWLRPNGRNRRGLCDIVRQAGRRQLPYVQLMLHSSELMPGGSPTFPTRRHIEALYRDLEAVLTEARRAFAGATLREFRAQRETGREP